MTRIMNQLTMRTGGRLWAVLAHEGARAGLIFGHPVVMRFTPGPAGGGIPPGFFSGLLAPAAGAMLTQGVVALGVGVAGRKAVPSTLHLLRSGSLRQSLAAFAP